MPSPNIQRAFDYLTGNEIVERSGGKLQPMTPQGASGLIGGWIVETGKENLEELDVVEKGNNQAGRGISQFSHSRRPSYDAARAAALKSGVDPNSIDFQLGYAVDEYVGKHDPAPGKSLSGWTKSFENFGQAEDVRDAAIGFTSGLDGKEGYFRPTTPHMDRRIEAAQRVYSHMTAPQIPEVPTKPAPGMMTISPKYRK